MAWKVLSEHFWAFFHQQCNVEMKHDTGIAISEAEVRLSKSETSETETRQCRVHIEEKKRNC